MYVFSADFGWLVLGDQDELDDKRGIWEYQLGEISRFIRVLDATENGFIGIFNGEGNNTVKYMV